MNDTNVFRQSANGAAAPRPGRDRKPLVVFALCLVLGAVVIYRHASHGADRERNRTQAEALARALALEMQLDSSLAAADVLGALVRQTGGYLPNFQQRAAELIASHPGVDSLELQPGGVVSEVAPRAGHESAVGKNVFNNPATRAGAMTAMQSRRLAVTGPVTLARGGFGVVGQSPLFVTGRDGREAFWGFAAVTVRLGDVVHRARLDELTAKGYDFLLFSPEQGGQPAAGLVASGTLPRSGSVQQVVRAQNLALRLAVYPRAGWFSLRDVAVWSLGAVLVSALVAGWVSMFTRRGALSDSLTRANAELVRAREETVQAKTESTRAREQLTRAETQAAHDQKQLARNNELLAAARDQTAKMAEKLARDREDFDLAREELAREKEDFAKKKEQLAADLEQLTRAHAQCAGEKEQLSLATEQLNGRLEKLTRAGEQLREQLAQSNEQAAHRAEQLAQEKESLAQASERAARAEAQLKQATRRIEKLEQRLAARASEAAALPAADVLETTAPIIPATAAVAGVEQESSKPEPASVEPVPPPPNEVPVPFVGPAISPPPVPEPDRSADLQVRADEALRADLEVRAPARIKAGDQRQEEQGTSDEPAERSLTVAAPSEAAPPEQSRARQQAPQATPSEPPQKEDGTFPAPAPAVELKPAIRTRPPRQKKVRKDDQLSLFGAPEPAEAPIPASAPADQPLTKEIAPESPPRPAGGTPPRRVTLVEEPLTEEPATPQAEPVPPVTATEEVPVKPRAKKHDDTPSAAASEPPPAPPVEAAPPVPAEPHPDLPEIEGLDTVAGLASAEGNPKHYLKVIRQFVAEQANAAERIRDLLVQGQPDEAARCTHTLRGVAENIGATALRAAASDLEHIMAGPSDPADIETVWSAMEKILSALVADLKSALKPKEEKAPSLPPPPPVDPPVLRRAVNEILPLLTDLDPGAAECLKANRKTFRSAFSSEGFVEFEQQVKAAAYREALDLLKKAAKKHGVLR